MQNIFDLDEASLVIIPIPFYHKMKYTFSLAILARIASFLTCWESLEK
jgi:hypothetical protein